MKTRKKRKTSLSFIMTMLVVCIVSLACAICVNLSVRHYQKSVEQNAITSSGQTVNQIKNMVSNYTVDMNEIMEMIRANMDGNNEDEFFHNLIAIRKDVEAIMIHTTNGTMMEYWSDGKEIKENLNINLSYEAIEGEQLHISAPHVQNLFQYYYPWVVTISEQREMENGEKVQISMDIRFSNIASYVDEAGIGAHGYCFIMDDEGNIVYHPQQQLIYAGLKDEETDFIRELQEGTHTKDGMIYTVAAVENCNWKIIGVSYVEELITSKVHMLTKMIIIILIIVIFTTAIAGTISIRNFSKPAKELVKAMKRFEKEGEQFAFDDVGGTLEIQSLSDSFGHMVLRIQALMDRVRQEEITLRKTELKALQAQINPHFLYNTLDSIAWMCEEERNKEAVEMVNALARLFRISISKGHELITIEDEIKHAQYYLKIQQYRYKNKFSYSFHVDQNCVDYLCNKITLQPLIENAIYHGLDMVDEGEISVHVYEDGEDIVMTVADNGVGMTEEQCESILRSDANHGIGIKNVNDRIKIYFGERYGLSVTSELDEGTTVEIRMPKILEEKHEI